MTNRLELNWKVDGFIDEQRYYCSATPIDPENLPAPKAVLAGDVRAYTDTDVVADQNYHVRISSSKDGVEKISDELLTNTFERDPFWNDVVCLLRFNDNIIDEKGNIWNTTDSLVYQPAKFGKGFAMNGSTIRRVQLPWSELVNFSGKSVTFDFWYKHARSSSWAGLIAERTTGSAGANFLILADAGVDKLKLETGSGSIYLDVISGEMAFISFEIDIEAGKLRSYLNGNLKSEIQSLGITSKLQIPLRVGTMNSSAYPGNGIIDEVRITKAARYKGLNFLPPVKQFPNQ